MALMAVRYTWISIQSIEHKFWTEMNNFSEFIAHLSLLDFLRDAVASELLKKILPISNHTRVLTSLCRGTAMKGLGGIKSV